MIDPKLAFSKMPCERTKEEQEYVDEVIKEAKGIAFQLWLKTSTNGEKFAAIAQRIRNNPDLLEAFMKLT